MEAVRTEQLARYFAQHPAAGILYEMRERLCQLLLLKDRNAHASRPLARQSLGDIESLRQSTFAPLASLGETLYEWRAEIGRMWRFRRSNGITEGSTVPHEYGSVTAPRLRFSKLKQLFIEGCCNVFLRKLGSGTAPDLWRRAEPEWMFGE